MFSFEKKNHNVLIKNIAKSDVTSKHSGNYIIAKDVYNDGGKFYGDVLAILTKEEFEKLDLRECKAPKFYIWEGVTIRDEVNENRLGIYI